MTNEDFIKLANETGFRRVEFLDYNGKILIFLLIPYLGASGIKEVREGVISGYYPVSNEAYRKAKLLAEIIKDLGSDAESNLQLPLKQLLLKADIGDMGRNSLVSVDELGSRFHIQTILTDYPFTTSAVLKDRVPRLAERCLYCSRCVNACPVGAIKPEMHIDADLCLRSVSEMSPPPQALRPLLGNKLLGCDICQDVCPANYGLSSKSAPVVELQPLLQGDIAQLKELIGVNYARKKRLRIKAAIAAANNRRKDLLDDLIKMSESSDEDEKEIAQWAIKEILAKLS